jgi:soluble lytic murein transglycosylase-like protein
MPFCAARLVRATLAFGICLVTVSPAGAETFPATVPTAYASVMRTINPHLQFGQSRTYANVLLASAKRMHVDPTLMMAVVTVESHWNSSAVSIHGAEGLGQIKPSTAHELGVDPRSGTGNLRGLAMYLHRMLSLFHEARQPMREALAGYNAGPNAVRSYGGIPPNGQTRRYVSKVMSALAMVRKRLGPQVLAHDKARGPSDALIAQIVNEDTAFWGAR